MNSEAAVILLVEDDDDHAELLKASLASHRVAHRLIRVSDGEAAMAYLDRRGIYSDPSRSPRPALVLLDLRLPKMDGIEVLAAIKASPELGKTPVVMLTTSDADKDVAAAYEHHANSYVVKPVGFTRLVELMDTLCAYWIGWNQPAWAPEGKSRRT